MIRNDEALRLLQNIVGDGLTQQDVGEWMASGIARLEPELDMQDWGTLLRIVSGETIAKSDPKLVQDIADSLQGLRPVTEGQGVRDAFHWDVT